jgi:hypothetical protein
MKQPIVWPGVALTCAALLACAPEAEDRLEADTHPVQAPSDVQSKGDPSVDLEEAARTVQAALSSDGHWVGVGAYWYLQYAYCVHMVAELGTCFGVNPGSPYGMRLLPRAPGEPAPEIDMSGVFRALGQDELVGLSPGWRLRADEALVYLGTTPPNARYFAHANYLFARPDESEGMFTFTETDLPLNDDVLRQEHPSGQAFSQPLVVITTANAQLAETITDALVAAGVGRDLVFVQRIPTVGADVPMGYAGSVFMHLDRVAYAEGAQRYFDAPPAHVFRVVPPEGTQSTPYEMWRQPRLATGESDRYLADALDILRNAVRRAHRAPSRTIELNRFVPAPFKNPWCLVHGFPTCLGVTADALYTLGKAGTGIGSTADDFLITIGVNHTLTTKAKYNSMTLYAANIGTPVASVSDRAMPGSVMPYLAYMRPADARSVAKVADRLYVHRFGRHCPDDDAFCSEIPEPAPDRVGLADGQPWHFFGRAYREPRTLRAPAPHELLHPYLLVSRPR